MTSFRKFDALAQNDFWTESVDAINRGLEKNILKDTKQLSGISLVIGCPLSISIQSNIAKLESTFDKSLNEQGSNAKVLWRNDLSALHITVYGLILPKDYNDDSWQLINDKIDDLKSILLKHKGFELHLAGLGILGRGAISLRISDSPQLESFRDDVSKIEGISSLNFGGRTTKVVIGRVLPTITESDRKGLWSICNNLRDFEVGSITIDELTLVHYEHTFLDSCKEKRLLTL